MPHGMKPRSRTNACLPMGVPRSTPFPYRSCKNYTHKPDTHMFLLHEGNILVPAKIHGRPKHRADLIRAGSATRLVHWEKDTLVIDTVGYTTSSGLTPRPSAYGAVAHVSSDGPG